MTTLLGFEVIKSSSIANSDYAVKGDFRKHHLAASHSCFVEKYKTRAPQWENDFNTFSAYNSQYIMIFWILQQCWGMLVVLSGHPVNVGVGYWWF